MPARIHVSFDESPGKRHDWEFVKPFRIGRTGACDICISNDYVSRSHVEVAWENGCWTVRDLNSSNGVYVKGERVEHVPVEGSVTIRLGIKGPEIHLEAEQPPKKPSPAPPIPATPRDADHYRERYFGKLSADVPVSEHTMMVRRAFVEVQKKQRFKYGWIIGALAVLFLSAGGYAFYLHKESKERKALAENLFYSMKSLDVDIGNLEKVVLNADNQQGREEIRKYQSRRKEQEQNYDQFLRALHVYDPKMTPQDQLILRVARIFGECELAMPPEFATEINNYIGKWRSSGRLVRAVALANQKGYTNVIAREFLSQNLPPQFFYLALQESDFDPFISGPMTRKGIAKGMWQFIPETAKKYGLRVGPLMDFPRPDPGDDRHHWERATQAATRYIKELYTTDAQASGLLVMACYNWGEDRVLPLVKSMPANPRERNFWRLLTKYRNRIPQETYDYVFYIASAAVIGENPRLWGFNFDNPLGNLEAH